MIVKKDDGGLPRCDHFNKEVIATARPLTWTGNVSYWENINSPEELPCMREPDCPFVMIYPGFEHDRALLSVLCWDNSDHNLGIHEDVSEATLTSRNSEFILISDSILCQGGNMQKCVDPENPTIFSMAGIARSCEGYENQIQVRGENGIHSSYSNHKITLFS